MAKLYKYLSFPGALAFVKKYLRTEYDRYFLLALVRVILVFLPQTGYVHKDEFFDSFEDAAGDALGVDSARGWRIDAEGVPNRHIFFPLALIGGPLFLLKYIQTALSYISGFPVQVVTPYSTLVAPRLLMCLLSFLVDYCMIGIYDTITQNNPKAVSYRVRRLTLLAGSGAMIIYGTRTITGALEMYLFTALVYEVTRSICHSNASTVIIQEDEVKVISYTQNEFATAMPIAALAVCGYFNRPGFAIFAAFPIIAWMLRTESEKNELGNASVAFTLAKRVLSLALGAAPPCIILSGVDTLYYGAPSPYNEPIAFVNQPAVDGSDPRPPWIPFFNAICLFNILGIVAIWRSINTTICLLVRKNYFAGKRMEAFLTWCSAGPIFLMAILSPFGLGAKEDHYLLPVLPLFVLLNCDIFEYYHHYNTQPTKQPSNEQKQEQTKSTEDKEITSARQIYVCTCRVPSIPVALLGLPKEPEDLTLLYGGSGGQRRIRYGRRVYMNELGNCIHG
ncbi:GPI mannosyltransferase 4-like [Ctenocephalides felis]|uniref:GPI mannosyltransferase 4-like n=1 Tax=Ctenocephalides felis TaxID=7515 RepID=UPI000E6E2782|nr:GPI mannosyltransferase 4-like [Ctenocephalides felis]